MLINLFPDDLKIQFMKNRWFFFALSSLLILASLILVPTRGLNFGIDFVGGIVIEIETPEKVDIGGIRTALDSVSGPHARRECPACRAPWRRDGV